MKVKSYAKINLVLQITGKRDDGYHNIDSIMTLVNLYDVLDIKINNTGEINLVSNAYYLPLNEKNIVYKCLKKMQEEFGFKQGFDINITKKIPVKAGLGGGSSNGAYAMLAANELLKLNLTKQQLIDVGVKVGADIPFFIKSSLARVRGIGEEIDTFESNMDFNVVLVKNKKGVSTKKAYEKLVLKDGNYEYANNAMEALIDNDYDKLLNSMVNDLEEPVFEYLEEIKDIKETMEGLGFDKCLMSGSGSTVFGITKDKVLADAAVKKLREKYNFVFATKILHYNKYGSENKKDV